VKIDIENAIENDTEEEATMEQRFDVDVVVVGAGPAGLAAAAELGHRGCATLLVERRTEPSTVPKATVASTRVMELLRAWGLEAEVRAGGVEGEVWLWECETLARAVEGSAHAVGYPSRAQAAVVSPTAPAIVPQDWLEGVLTRHVAALSSVRVELGTEVVALRNGADAVEATLRRGDGDVRTVRARHAVAADGAHGAIRPALGVGVHQWEGALGGVQVVFRAPLSHLLGDHRYALYVVTEPEAPGVFLPAGVGDRWVYGPSLASSDVAPADLDRSWLAAAIRTGAGDARLEPRIERIGAFYAPGEIADRFRVGRTFLTGDAAHRVTPRGGTGMNLAIQSGYDLGWKLAWVLRGWAGAELLDTYESERRIVAEHNLARSTDADGSRRPVVTELAVDLAGRVAHAWVPGSHGRSSTLDLLGPGWTVFTGPARAAWDATARGARVGAPVSVRPLDAVTARAVGVRADGAVLARPDGVPVAVWASAAGARQLRQAMHAAANPPAGQTLAA
jgi:2-polyprenyl-6-methoxyphenol hydroxylase-like FAD-dependent oxidoreductase